MSPRELPIRPNLEHLKNQARVLLQQHRASEPAAVERFTSLGIYSETPKYADALHIIARDYGFDTWPALKLSIDLAAEDPRQALFAALRANDTGGVRQVLARNTSLQAEINKPLPQHSFGAPPLVAAVYKNNREMIDLLLDAGADINGRTDWWAGSFGVLDAASPELADYLISRGAKLDIHSAARLGMVDQVRDFLRADPSLVHARGADGQLPLHFAATVEIAALLLDLGADVDARDVDHESTAAQYMACMPITTGSERSYRHELVRFLLSRGAQTDIIMASAIGDLALVESILNEDPETIRTTVTERSFPKRDPKSGGVIYTFGFGATRSPHMIARQFGHTAVFDLLMQRSTPWLRLLQAAEMADETLVAQILQRHPTLFARLSSNAARRIIGTAVRNNTRAVEILLASGWPSNATLDNGQTALHYAAFHGNTAMVRTLLAHNAPVNVFETEHGGNSLAWALYGSLHSWERDTGDYPAVTRLLLSSAAQIPKLEEPFQATEDVLEIIRQHQLPAD